MWTIKSVDYHRLVVHAAASNLPSYSLNFGFQVADTFFKALDGRTCEAVSSLQSVKIFRNSAFMPC
ncbi:MAG: hypothetical protein IJ204_01565 [Paludibacteraceae bacterium]|nr:hypothetical protein [Paludibacteraceae bacterium]